MKKLLISILIALLIALSIFIGWNGLKIGNLEILGLKGIKEKNDNLDTQVEKATRLASVDYKKATSEVQENIKQMKEQKKNYEDMTILNTDSDGATATQIQKYEIETLWVKLGNYATSEGATIKIDLTKGSNTTQETYNLNFTVNGRYISITDFISDIENDSTLGFKIENFKMYPNTDDEDNVNNLQATFTCKDIAIVDVDTTVSTIQTSTSSTDTTNTTNSNTTNSNTTNTATNATNTTNAKSSANTTNSANTNSAQ